MLADMISPCYQPSADCHGLDLTRHLEQFLREHGETRPVPLLGGFVLAAQPTGRVHVFWRLPGPPLFATVRRRRHLRRYARLLRGWGMATEEHSDAPEPYVACWIRAGHLP